METENKLQCMESPTQKDNRKKKKIKNLRLLLEDFQKIHKTKK